MVTVSKFDKSKPVYYQWLHQPLYNKTQDTNCWYQLTSRPALNRTKPVNLLQGGRQGEKNTWHSGKHQILFVPSCSCLETVCFSHCRCGCSGFACREPMKTALRTALMPLVAHVSSICKYFQDETITLSLSLYTLSKPERAVYLILT